MSVQFPAPPDEVTDAIITRMRDVDSAPEAKGRVLGDAEPAELTLSMPHDVYVVGIDDILAGRRPDSTSPAGWRFILYNNNRTVASAETVVTSEGKHRFALFNSGPFVAATVDTVDRMNSDRRVIEQNPTLSLLRIPALHVEALWLHDGEDTYTPLAPAPQGLSTEREYSLEELFDALRTQAQAHASIGVDDETGS